jgi:integral membrane protein (TIGR00529 family)
MRLQLSLCLFIGSVVICFLMGLGPMSWFQSAVGVLVEIQTISLILIVWLILAVSRIMNQTGHMDRLVESFTRLSKDARTVGSVMSALIGLLPMPGGALFSAPMVETSLSNNRITGEQKAMVNYWFRHIWEYWWPLYPGVVLVVALLEVDMWRYMAIMAPMTIVCVLVGAVFILKPIGKAERHHGGWISWSGIKAFLWEIMPILIVVFIILVLAGLTGILGLLGFQVKIPGTVSILPGLVAAIIWVCLINHVVFDRFISAAIDRSVIPMVLLVLAIMVFKRVMVDSHAVPQIIDELIAYKIPAILVIVMMPFISGFITGMGLGLVGTSFPIIIPLFQTSNLIVYLSYAGLGYTFGFMGMMLSPVHLCLLVSKDYYEASLLKTYRHLILPAMTVMIFAGIYFMVLRAL